MGGIIGLCLLLQPSTAPRIHSIIAISSALFYHDRCPSADQPTLTHHGYQSTATNHPRQPFISVSLADSAWTRLPLSSFRHLEPLAYLEPAISFLDVPTSTTLYSYLSLFPGLVHYPSNAHPTVIQDLLRNGFHRLPMKVGSPSSSSMRAWLAQA